MHSGRHLTGGLRAAGIAAWGAPAAASARALLRAGGATYPLKLEKAYALVLRAAQTALR